MTEELILKGRKGQKTPPPPTRVSDNLRSEDTVEVLIGVSEGPILGLWDQANPGKSYYLGDTLVQNNDGSDNFGEVTLEQWPGDAVADPVNLELGGSSTSTSVNVNLFVNTPVVRSGQVPGITKIDVRLLVQSLYLTNTNGDVLNNDLEFKIEYKPTAGSTWTVVDGNQANGVQKITGKTTSAYVKEIRFTVPEIAGTYDVRVTKLSAETTDESIRELTWESFQEITTTSRTYDNTAITRIFARATDQFSSIPQFSGIYGGRLLQVPTIYNPTTRDYDFSGGPWDGSFKIAWTDNPAWILYDLIMNENYGLRRYRDVTINRYDVLEAAIWCDACDPVTGSFIGVPDGSGGQQARYTFNGVIQEPRPGQDQIRFMAGLFNSQIIDGLNGELYLRVDKDDTAIHLFAKENVVDGQFVYSFTDVTTRYNDISVTFLNPDLNWGEDRRRVFNQDDIDLNGPVVLDFIATGCLTSQEAIRRAQHRLISSITEKMLVSFQTNTKGEYVDPYDVILISDDDLGYGASGRILSLSSDRKTVTFRDPIYLEVGISYSFNIMVDGVESVIPLSAVGSTGNVTQITLTGAVPAGAPEYAVFSLSQSGAGLGLPKPFRVMSIQEAGEGYQISAVEINRNKYDAVDSATWAGSVDYNFNFNPDVIPSPTNLTATVRIRNTSAGVRRDVVLNWDRSASSLIRKHEIQLSFNDDAFQVMDQTSEATWTLTNIVKGTYIFHVTAINILNRRSVPAEVTLVVDEAPVAVPTVTNVQTTNGPATSATQWYGQDVKITWDVEPVVAWDNYEINAPYPYLKRYRIEIYDGPTLLNTYYSQARQFTYEFAQNAADHGGTASRTLRFSVSVEDIDSNFGTAGVLDATNPAPTLGTVDIDGAIDGYFIGLTPTTDEDWRGTLIWAKETSGYTPSAANADYDAYQTQFFKDVVGPKTLYVRVAFYDSFGKIDLDISNEIQVDVLGSVFEETEYIFSGIKFDYHPTVDDSIVWSGGEVSYGPVGGTPTTITILPSSGITWSSGVLYVYYVDGTNELNFTTSIVTAYSQPGRVVAVYRGGTSLFITGNGVEGPTPTLDERAFTFDGLVFTPNSPSTNQVSWTAGNAHYGVIGGSVTSKAISTGNATWSSGTLYLYYVEGATALSSGTDLSAIYAAGGRILATYKGGTNLVVGDGKPIISGTDILAGTVGANQIVTGTAVITQGAQISDAIIDNAKITNLAGDKILAGTVGANQLVTNTAVITLAAQIANAIISDAKITNLAANKILSDTLTSQIIYVGDSTFRLEAGNKRIVVYDAAGTQRIVIGGLGPGTTNYGILIKDASGNEILRTGSSNTLNGAFINALDAAKITTGTLSADRVATNSLHFNKLSPTSVDIITDMIHDNAVTNIVSSFGYTGVPCGGYATEVEFVSVSVTVPNANAQVILLAGAKIISAVGLESYVVYDPGNPNYFGPKFRRNGTVIYEKTLDTLAVYNGVWQLRDNTPAVGVNTYQFNFWNGVSNFGPGAVTAYERSLIALSVKK